MKAKLKDRVIAESDDIVEEAGYHYFPISVTRMEWLKKAPKTPSDHACPHGVQFYDVLIEGKRHERAAWIYEAPRPSMRHVAGRVGFWNDIRGGLSDGNEPGGAIDALRHSPAANLRSHLQLRQLHQGAREVNLTQSAVSLHVKRLEDQVGSRLIVRNVRGLRLTEQGEVLQSYARRILALYKEAEQRLGRDSGGQIRIGVPEYFDLHTLSSLLGQFSARYPAIR
ncbi:MAG TPA: LysR family transcriptional regulator, partial [Methyloceanibacter sp.]|nr:LysR family transcriptional regulator [Methyloceanibacter sp.]